MKSSPRSQLLVVAMLTAMGIANLATGGHISLTCILWGLAILNIALAVHGFRLEQGKSALGRRRDPNRTGIGRLISLATSRRLPYRIVLFTLYMFLVLRYVLAPGTTVTTDAALAVFVGALGAFCVYLLTRVARRQ